MANSEKVEFHPGLYIHIPFCLSRCGYCAFVSGLYDPVCADRYLERITAELQQRAVFSPSNHPSTVFIGGGTPSSLTVDQLQRLFGRIPLPQDGEVTCEMNPDSADKEKLRIAREGGINRISFGVQTFSPPGLRLLGRRHGVAEAVQAVHAARRAGFERISIDLINGYPGQTEQTLADDCRQALDLGLTHVSCYNFILEEDAPGYAALSSACGDPDDEHDRRLWDVVEEWLCVRGGFEHYEISNFAKPGQACRHNLAIWRGGAYVGIGVAACGYIGGRRYGNTTDIDSYLDGRNSGDIEAWSEKLAGKAAARECAVFWLRLYEGIELERFREQTGYDLVSLYGEQLQIYLRDGMMEYSDGGTHLRVVPAWMPVLDSILVDLV